MKLRPSGLNLTSQGILRCLWSADLSKTFSQSIVSISICFSQSIVFANIYLFSRFFSIGEKCGHSASLWLWCEVMPHWLYCDSSTLMIRGNKVINKAAISVSHLSFEHNFRHGFKTR